MVQCSIQLVTHLLVKREEAIGPVVRLEEVVVTMVPGTDMVRVEGSSTRPKVRVSNHFIHYNSLTQGGRI